MGAWLSWLSLLLGVRQAGKPAWDWMSPYSLASVWVLPRLVTIAPSFQVLRFYGLRRPSTPTNPPSNPINRISKVLPESRLKLDYACDLYISLPQVDIVILYDSGVLLNALLIQWFLECVPLFSTQQAWPSLDLFFLKTIKSFRSFDCVDCIVMCFLFDDGMMMMFDGMFDKEIKLYKPLFLRFL